MNAQHHQVLVIIWLTVTTQLEDILVIVSLVLNWLLITMTALVSLLIVEYFNGMLVYDNASTLVSYIILEVIGNLSGTLLGCIQFYKNSHNTDFIYCLI